MNYPLKERVASFFLSLLLFPWINRAIHVDMAYGSNSKCFCSYKYFKYIFCKFESEFCVDNSWPDSLFSVQKYDFHERNYIHASIFRINGVNHVLSAYGYLMASRLIKRTIKKKAVENKSITYVMS